MGTHHPPLKYSNLQAAHVRFLLQFWTGDKIAKRMDVPRSFVECIRNGNRPHVEPEAPPWWHEER